MSGVAVDAREGGEEDAVLYTIGGESDSFSRG